MNTTVTSPALSDDDLRAQINALHESSGQGCGSVYELYSERFHLAVERAAARLDDVDAGRFLKIAETDFDYERNGLKNLAKLQRADDTCAHYLDPNCCPLGCGDLDDEIVYDDEDEDE